MSLRHSPRAKPCISPTIAFALERTAGARSVCRLCARPARARQRGEVIVGVVDVARLLSAQCDHADRARRVIVARRKRSPRDPRRGDRVGDGAIVGGGASAPAPWAIAELRSATAGEHKPPAAMSAGCLHPNGSELATGRPAAAQPSPCDTATPALLVADWRAGTTACRIAAVPTHAASRTRDSGASPPATLRSGFDARRRGAPSSDGAMPLSPKRS
jgi:hypothetical protein